MAKCLQLTAPNGVSYQQPTGLFINNEFVEARSGKRIESLNPYDESPIASVAAGDESDIDLAVAAARKAFEAGSEWRRMDPQQRGALLWKLGDLCERDRRWADKIYVQTIDVGPAKLAYTKHEPLGVCGLIVPWNFPIMMAAWKLGPALACGNTIILKAAEQTPLSVLYLASLVKEAGFPPGVINIINGYGRVAGAALASHMGVDKIAFTGSTMTGKTIMEAASRNLKSITLETGGKSPLIIFEDADIQQAVPWSHIGIMSMAGQICTSTSRIYVHESIYDRFIDLFKRYTVQNTIVGSQFDSRVTHGPQVSRAQQEKILSYVDSARSEGARLVLGGTAPAAQKGYFVNPTIFADVKDDMKVVREEIFGPFVVMQSFSTQDEVVRKANKSEYGLGAAVFTKDIVRGHEVAGAIEADMVWINSSQDSHFGIPFGGYKQSGIGRELGQYALSAYTQVKSVHVNLRTVL